MSRRKQGRPQQRKATDSLEQENDLLVCGDCQANFPLKDILRFIRHKVRRCNKENVDILDGVSFDDEDEGEEEAAALACIGSKLPGISAPIARKESVESRPSPRPSLDSQKEISHEEKMVTDGIGDGRDACDRVPLRPKKVVDAESNTILSEPSRFVCENCKTTFNSAWTLLQHAQKEHGMKIYTTPSPQLDISTPSPRPSTEHRTPPSISSGQDSPFSHSSHTQAFRLPLDHVPPPPQHSSPLHVHPPLSPFNRPPHTLDFPMEMMSGHHPLLRPGLIPGLEHHHHPPPPFSHPAFDRSRLSLDSHFDLFSKRLQQLAHVNPSLHATGPPFSPAAAVLTSLQQHQQLQQHHHQQQQQQQQQHISPQCNRQSPQTEPQQKSSRIHSHENLTRLPGTCNSNKPFSNKACEFCGKTFRFQSNLIVHRRSHTGEKPFKCRLCPHACTQQSKLKRHMKTHMNKPTGSSGLSGSLSNSDGSVLSSSSTPDSNKNVFKMDGSGYCVEEDEEDDFDDEEDIMEEEDLEEEDIEAMNEEAEEDRRSRQSQAQQMQNERLGQVKHLHERLVNRHDEQEVDDNNEFDNRCSDNRSIDNRSVDNQSNCSEKDQGSNEGNYMNHNGSSTPDDKDKPQKSTLLSEVMENSGLKNIQQYKDAYQSALAENSFRHDSSKESDTEKDKEDNERCSSEEVKGEYSPLPQMSPNNRLPMPHPLNPFSYLSSGPSPIYDMHMKHAIKREPSSEAAMSGVDAATAAIYQHNWFPTGSPLRDIYPPFNPFGLPRDFGREQNGYNPAAAESALKALSVPKPGPSTPPSPINGNPLVRKDHRRNDTCEFCGKVFKNCSNLTVHRRSHTGEKPYKCGLCNYACAQSSKLTRHMKTHGRLGKDVFRCKFCSMPFSVPSTLEKHMRKCVESRHARLHMTEAERSAILSNGGDSHSGLMGDQDMEGRLYTDVENHHQVELMGDVDTSDTSSTTTSNL